MTELSTVRGQFHNLLDAKLNTEAAAAVVAAWSDKVQGRAIREWYHHPEASRELYRLLCYKVLCAAVSDEDPADIAFLMDSGITQAADKVAL